jgi:hypothetical protein
MYRTTGLTKVRITELCATNPVLPLGILFGQVARICHY